MRKKWLGSICVATMLTVGLSGCGSQIPDLTDEQRNAISEYAVQLLLKYDTNTDSRLVDLSLLEEEPEPTAQPEPTEEPVEQKPSGMDEVADTPVIELEGEAAAGGDMKSALGLAENISFEYADYQIVEEYTDVTNNELVIEAASGNKLLVCNFVLVNDGAGKQTIDMLRENIRYTFKIADESIHSQVTLLSNDLTTYLGILDSDESRKVVVIAECGAEKLEADTEIYLEVQRGEDAAAIQVK